ncbi:molybdenum cofactor biosynthesis protein [Paenibacillus eucommiae]|uniref:Molybdopterin synthase catalytic subunit n=1 Tax=Paenibacillus eucommiae TaxID=1355755 RepID=A0ABS4J9Y1_9BACL|nr:molybdenum cofactor biosynthesis protein MoaE [Paenibacillus eucommiae]MBP1995891.1 molybdopterin synthase catalytic subunit [Paenibacillus eucommiae]
MKIQIQLFAGLVELMGASVLTMDIDQDTALTVSDLKKALIEQFPAASGLLSSCFFAVNQAYANEAEIISESDEIALIPPVSGGQGASAKDSCTEDPPTALMPRYTITYEPIQIETITSKVIIPNNGATLAFVGTTREFTYGQRTLLLEYEAYVPMALKMMEQIGGEAEQKWPGVLCAIAHRLGQVGIGETSVVIAISSPHRADCYEASRYAIERLKQIVPIWKKEVWEDGSEWKGSQSGPWNPTESLNQ